MWEWVRKLRQAPSRHLTLQRQTNEGIFLENGQAHQSRSIENPHVTTSVFKAFHNLVPLCLCATYTVPARSFSAVRENWILALKDEDRSTSGTKQLTLACSGRRRNHFCEDGTRTVPPSTSPLTTPPIILHPCWRAGDGPLCSAPLSQPWAGAWGCSTSAAGPSLMETGCRMSSSAAAIILLPRSVCLWRPQFSQPMPPYHFCCGAGLKYSN